MENISDFYCSISLWLEKTQLTELILTGALGSIALGSRFDLLLLVLLSELLSVYSFSTMYYDSPDFSF